MKNLNTPSQKNHYLAFEKASPEALDSLLNALNAEVDLAVSQKRIPSLDLALERLGKGPTTLQ